MQHNNTFSGGLEVNLDRHLVPSDKYVDALNIRIGAKDQIGVITNAKGNTLVNFTLPAGTNTVIGEVEDKRTASIYYFIKNSNGSDRILRYRNGAITLISKNGFLELENKIQAVIVDDLLYWTDATTSLTGNPPRKINVEKSRHDKIFTYEMVLGDTCYDVGAAFTVRVLDDSNNVVFPTTLFYTVPAGPPSRNAVAAAIVSNLGVVAGVTATSTYIPQTNCHRITVSYPLNAHSIILTGPNIWVHPTNNLDFIETNQLTVIKPCPKKSPQPRHVVDASITTNTIFGFGFQFRHRYIFDDGEKSAWSPASYTSTNFAQATLPELSDNSCVINSPEYTKIEVAFSDEVLNDGRWRALVKYIEVCVRNDQDGIWRLIDRYPIYQLGVNDPKITFRNDRIYQAVPSDEASASDAQALKNFDFVPRLSLTNELVSDESGNSVMTWGGNLEYYDYDDLLATVTVKTRSADGPSDPLVNQTSELKTLKGGGRYKVGVVLEDFYGRQSAVIPIDTVSIPFQDNLQYGLTVTIPTIPPAWCDRWRVCISRNMNQSVYYQLPAWRINRWNGNPDREIDMVATGATGTGEYTGFEFTLSELDTDLRNFFFDQLQEETKIFLPEVRDRLQVIYWKDATAIADTEAFNYPIVGYSVTYPTTGVTPDRFTVFVQGVTPDFAATLPTDYITCEIYRPSNAQSADIYYELSDAIDIVDNVEPSKRTFGSPIDVEFGDTYVAAKVFDQSVKGGSTPYKIAVRTQRPTLHQEGIESCNDLGRVVAFDPDYKEIFSYEQIRASDVYIPNSLSNGFSSFRGLNYVRINRAFGPIRRLALLDQVLLAIAEFKSQPIYISKGRLLDLTGDTTVGRTSRLLNVAQELQRDLGTKHPHSVVIEDGRIYAWDDFKKTAWFYTSGGGQDNLGLENELILASGDAIGGFEREYNTYYLTIGSTTYALGSTPYSKMTPAPDLHSRVGNDYVTFKNGALWLHDTGLYCHYYGVQSDCFVKFVVNSEPQLVKLFDNILQEGTGLWTATIEIPATPSYPLGMASRLITNKWNKYEGQYRADFLRDETDPSLRFSSIADPTQRLVTALLNGRPLRGEIAVITLKLINPQDKAILRNVKTEWK